MIQKQLFNALSPLVKGRFFYGLIPETNKDFPVMVYQFTNISPNSALDDGDLDDYQVQIDIYSQNPDDIFTLRKQVFTAIQRSFEFAERINDLSEYEADTKLHRRIINYQIAYGE